MKVQDYSKSGLNCEHYERSIGKRLSDEESLAYNNEIREILKNPDMSPEEKFVEVMNKMKEYFHTSGKKVAEETYFSNNRLEKGVATRILNNAPNCLNSQLINWIKLLDVFQLDDDNYMQIMLLLRKIKNYNHSTY